MGHVGHRPQCKTDSAQSWGDPCPCRKRSNSTTLVHGRGGGGQDTITSTQETQQQWKRSPSPATTSARGRTPSVELVAARRALLFSPVHRYGVSFPRTPTRTATRGRTPGVCRCVARPCPARIARPPGSTCIVRCPVCVSKLLVGDLVPVASLHHTTPFAAHAHASSCVSPLCRPHSPPPPSPGLFFLSSIPLFPKSSPCDRRSLFVFFPFLTCFFAFLQSLPSAYRPLRFPVTPSGTISFIRLDYSAASTIYPPFTVHHILKPPDPTFSDPGRHSLSPILTRLSWISIDLDPRA